MNKLVTTSVFALALCLSSAAMAFSPTGGFSGPGLAESTVAQAVKMSDDTPVVLVGKIEKSLGGEKYLFKDASGSVIVDIDDDDWRGLNVTPADTIIIEGEVDKGLFEETKIDVDSVRLKK